MSVTRSPWTAYFFLPFLWSYGADILDAEGKIVINSPEAVQSVEFYDSLVDSGAIPTGSDIFDFRALFAKDKLGFYWDAPVTRGILEQMSGMGEEFRPHYACMLVPVGPTGKPESTLWGHWLTVFKTSKNKDAAYKFIDYLTSDPDIIKMYHDTMGRIHGKPGQCFFWLTALSGNNLRIILHLTLRAQTILMLHGFTKVSEPGNAIIVWSGSTGFH